MISIITIVVLIQIYESKEVVQIISEIWLFTGALAHLVTSLFIYKQINPTITDMY